MIKLSLLIPSLIGREESLNVIIKELERQCGGIMDIGVYILGDNENLFTHYFRNGVQSIAYIDNRKVSIGKKRNMLLDLAVGGYIAYIDDDDRISGNYIEFVMEGIEKSVDCCSLKGMYSIDGRFDGIFEHSIKYNQWRTTANEVKFERFPNHLNVIKAEIAKKFSFPEKNHGEDFDWSKRVHDSGLLKTEHYIEDIIYHYDFTTNKK